ncbi:MAG: DUF3450 domain-containing protein [Pseudomonadales bacterium]|nr:DUF3450 domain-containing protein [Pseudomonadales bacterium]
MRQPVVALAFSVALLGASTAVAEEQGGEDALLKEYIQVTTFTDGLKTYNAQEETLLRAQEREMATLRDSIDSVTETRRQIGPLTERMIENLATFIELDAPFQIEARREKITQLRYMLDRTDLSIADKFRQVVDAYKEEIDYGNTQEVYSDFLEIDGKQRQVDVLRWGRAVLCFQTPDGELSGVWDNNERQWKVLSDDYKEGIRNGLRIAQKTKTNDLVLLPTAAPEQRPGPLAD